MLIDKLNCTWVDMKKAIAMSTKTHQSAEVVADPSPRLCSATSSLGSVLENIDTLHSDTGWTIKFRKRQGIAEEVC